MWFKVFQPVAIKKGVEHHALGLGMIRNWNNNVWDNVSQRRILKPSIVPKRVILPRTTLVKGAPRCLQGLSKSILAIHARWGFCAEYMPARFATPSPTPKLFRVAHIIPFNKTVAFDVSLDPFHKKTWHILSIFLNIQGRGSRDSGCNIAIHVRTSCTRTTRPHWDTATLS